jgi:hypothetical protein
MASAASTLDVSRPETAAVVGTELARTTEALAGRLVVCAVTDLVSLEQAVGDRQQIGAAIKSVEEFFAPLKSLAHRLHRALCDRENAILKPLQSLDRQKSNAISDFKSAQDRLRQQREREEAEARRRESEAQAAAEAAALESQGQPELAAAVIEESISAPLPVVALPDVTKAVEGLRFTRTWHWRFSGGPRDVKQTAPETRARTMRLVPRDFLTLDESKLTKYATSMKDTARVPGIDFYFVDTPRR